MRVREDGQRDRARAPACVKEDCVKEDSRLRQRGLFTKKAHRRKRQLRAHDLPLAAVGVEPQQVAEEARAAAPAADPDELAVDGRAVAGAREVGAAAAVCRRRADELPALRRQQRRRRRRRGRRHVEVLLC